LEVELEDHLGYPKHGQRLEDGNARNGTRSKTVITEVGPVELDVPRDRDGSFEPQTVRKRQRRLHGVDSMVISLVAKGLTTGEVQAHLAETHDTNVSRETISKITDWVRDGQVTNRPCYCAIGVSVEGRRDILGLWIGTGGERAKYWLQVLTEIKNRGTDDVVHGRLRRSQGHPPKRSRRPGPGPSSRPRWFIVSEPGRVPGVIRIGGREPVQTDLRGPDADRSFRR
jgi:putative transposase